MAAERGYKRLCIEEFGRQLITTGDLDPVYIALRRCKLPLAVRSRWLIAYWCLYHCGAASFLSEEFNDSAFWEGLMEAARNVNPAPTGGRWPRASERRHWRGEQATRSVEDLASRGSPTELVASLAVGPMDCGSVMKRAQEWRGFGPWIGFKIADMMDRVLGCPVNFNQASVFMFKDPAKAAVMMHKERRYRDGARTDEERITTVVKVLTNEFSDLTAPPLGDRPIGLQEVETVLCKWKSHTNGHYPLYNDTDEINHGLAEWRPHSPVAELFARNMVQREDR